ncbi:PAS domain S-box protein [Pseudomonas sp.]|uniref:PAS domain S-box protein n=1 Tax=Pseudomonas sp. TaxID=306 RepID=UPI002B6321BB|nr:PAS domain S-box protein [Pseudomonas sp.]HUE93495.1 PAS domain S-box protein [Pseudomonas sp.]
MHTRHLIVAAYLHVLAFAMLGLGAISLIGYLLLEQPTRHNVVLLPDSALMSVLMGGLILAATRQAMAARQLLAALLVALTLYSLLHNLLAGGENIGQSWLSGFLRMRSGLAVSMLLATLALYLSGGARLARRVACLAGGALMILAILSQLADSWPPLEMIRLGFKYDATHVANLFVLCLGLSIIMLSLHPRAEHDRLDPRTLSAGIFGTLLACSSWYLLSTQAIHIISREGDMLLTKMASAATEDLQSHLTLIQRMTDRWQIVGLMPSPSLWQQEAHSSLRDFPNLKLLALLDHDLDPRRLEARNPAQAAWLRQLVADADQRSWLQEVRDGKHPQIGQTRDYGDARVRNTLIASPLHLPGQPPLLLVASLNVPGILDNLRDRDLKGFIVHASEGDQLLYDSTSDPIQYAIPVSQRSLLLPYGQTWQLSAYVHNPHALNADTHLATLTLLFGLALSFFLLLSQRLAWLATEHSQQLQSANQDLQQSLALQLRTQNLNQRIMQFTHDVLCSIDRHGRFHELSPSCEKLFGYPAQTLIGQASIDLVLAEDRQQTQEEIVACMRARASHTLRNRCRHQDGRILHILWTVDWSEQAQTLFAVAHDITPLVVNEAYAESQREILSMISNDRPLGETLEALCLMIEAQQPGALCSVLLLDASGQHLHTGAAPNLPPAYSQALDGLTIGPRVGSCGTAAFLLKLVISEDIRSDPLWQDYRDLAQAHGLKACWSFPLISHDGKGLGTFGVYHRQPQTPDDEQIQHLATAAQLAAIGIARAADRRHLQESQQRFRSLFAFNPDPVFSFDLHGHFLSINDAGQQLLGLSEAEIIGKHFTGLIASDQQAQIREHLKAASAGTPQHYETRLQDRQHKALTLDVTNLPIMVDAQIVGVFGIAKNVSGYKQALAEAQALAERLRNTLESISDAFYTLDTDWRFTYTNHEAERLLQASAPGLLGQQLWLAFPGSYDSEIGEHYRQAMSSGQPRHFESFYAPLNGWFELHVYPSEEGLAVYFQNISERRRTQQELQATLLELERSNKELQEFAFVASHDLQEPLRKIQAFSERLVSRSTALDEDSRDYLQRMTSAAARMQALIIDLLNYSRVNTRGQPLQPLDLNQVLGEVLGDMEAAIEQSQARIDYPPLPKVLGDPSQLRQLLQNLLSNALKFQAPGNRPLIRLYVEAQNATHWTLCIADNGIGFDEKYLDRIFNPFQRLHGREAYAGTGIGLAIVKKIAERHSARITASSVPGQGSVFRITFPTLDRASL